MNHERLTQFSLRTTLKSPVRPLVQALSNKHSLICLGRHVKRHRTWNFIGVVKVAKCVCATNGIKRELDKLPLPQRGQWFAPPITEL